MAYHVYSTLTAPQAFTEWKKGGGDLPVMGRVVHIAGGTGVIKKRTFSTPLGVKTEISDEDYAFLMDTSHGAGMAFAEFIANGWITVTKKLADPDKAAANMSQRDGSAPIVPNDYSDESKRPKVSSDPKEAPTTKPRTKPVTGQGAFR
jgi:hypothetical protein